MFGNFLLFVDWALHLNALEYVSGNPGQNCNHFPVSKNFLGLSLRTLPQEECLVFRQKLRKLHPVDGVEEDDLLLACLHRARLHRDGQLDDGLDGAEAKLVVRLLAQHCSADLKH